MKHRAWIIVGLSLGAALLIWLSLWSWVLVSSQPFNALPARLAPWPVACTVRGCVSTTTWKNLHTAATKNAAAFKLAAPSLESTLTTVIRQKLVRDATVKSAVTMTDATKYRSEVLHLTNEMELTATTGLSLADYDAQVVLPFLEQEALRQQRHAESTSDLFQDLAVEHQVFVPLRTLGWDRANGQVVPR